MKKELVTLATLKKGAEELGIKIPAKATVDTLIKKISETLEKEHGELGCVCPNCDGDITEETVTCPYCGMEFEAEYTQEELEEMSDEELIEIAEENEIEVSYKGKGKSKKLDREALIEAILEESEDEEDDQEVEKDEDNSGEETEKDYEDMTDEELIQVAKENEIEVSYTGKGKSKKLNRDALIEELNSLEEEVEEDEDNSGEETEKDYEEMSDEELIAEAEENEIEVSYKGKGKSKKLDREALIEELNALEEDSEDVEAEEETEEAEKDYEEMSDEELIAEADEREIKVPYAGKGKSKKLDREALIALLSEEADEEDSQDEEEVKEEEPKSKKGSKVKEVEKAPEKEVEPKKSTKKTETKKVEKAPENKGINKGKISSPNYSKDAIDPIKKRAIELGFECIEKTSLNTFKHDGKRVFSQYKVPKTITLWIAIEDMPKMEGLQHLTKEQANDLHVGTTRGIWEGTEVEEVIAVVEKIAEVVGLTGKKATKKAEKVEKAPEKEVKAKTTTKAKVEEEPKTTTKAKTTTKKTTTTKKGSKK